jgi:hypothetical protein
LHLQAIPLEVSGLFCNPEGGLGSPDGTVGYLERLPGLSTRVGDDKGAQNREDQNPGGTKGASVIFHLQLPFLKLNSKRQNDTNGATSLLFHPLPKLP